MTPRKQISKFTCADSDTNGFPGALGSKQPSLRPENCRSPKRSEMRGSGLRGLGFRGLEFRGLGFRGHRLRVFVLTSSVTPIMLKSSCRVCKRLLLQIMSVGFRVWGLQW